MAEFVWGTDYRQYLQNEAYVNDIRDAQRSAARDTIAAIGDSSRSILLGVEAGMGHIADAQLEAAQLTADAQWEGARMTAAATEHAADRIVGAIGDLDSTFRWGFGQVLGTLGGMSTSLAALVQTAKTPAQTAAYEQFEIARDAFRKSLYEECLEALGKAITGDHTSPGYKLEWRFHHLVGVVRLGFPGCDVSLVDPAARSFRASFQTRYITRKALSPSTQSSQKPCSKPQRFAWLRAIRTQRCPRCGGPSTSIVATPCVPPATMYSVSTRKASTSFSRRCATKRPELFSPVLVRGWLN